MTLTRRQLLFAAAFTGLTACRQPLNTTPMCRQLPTACADGPYPRALVSGCSARSYELARGAFRDWIDGVVLSDWSWADLQPTPGPLADSALAQLVSALDWCHENRGTSGKRLKARLRINAGYLAPLWVKDATGGAVSWATRNGLEPGWRTLPALAGWAFLPGGVPRWWTKAMSEAYAEFQFLLAEAIGAHPAVAEICMTLPCTQYAEPCIRQGGQYSGNAAAAYATGYTPDLDLASFESGYSAHAEYWSPLRIATSVAFSPYQELPEVSSPDDAVLQDAATTIDLMNDMLATLGRMTVWANNGFRNPAPETYSSAYAAMYAAQFDGALQSPPVCITYQTKTLVEMRSHRIDYPAANLPNTVQQAVDVKATGLELPIGCTEPSSGVDYLPASLAARFNAQFATNALRYLD